MACGKRLYCASGRPTGLGGRQAASIASPSMKAMVAEAGMDHMYSGHMVWHGKLKANMVFVDGHVSLLAFAPCGSFPWHTGISDLFEY